MTMISRDVFEQHLYERRRPTGTPTVQVNVIAVCQPGLLRLFSYPEATHELSRVVVQQTTVLHVPDDPHFPWYEIKIVSDEPLLPLYNLCHAHGIAVEINERGHMGFWRECYRRTVGPLETPLAFSFWSRSSPVRVGYPA